nr:hypothetical protein Iba_chr13eCG6870 [Ipomoea batatas]
MRKRRKLVTKNKKEKLVTKNKKEKLVTQSSKSTMGQGYCNTAWVKNLSKSKIDGIFLCVTYQLYVSVFFLSKEGCNSMMSLYFFRLQFTARMKKLTTSAVIGRKKKPKSIPNPELCSTTVASNKPMRAPRSESRISRGWRARDIVVGELEPPNKPRVESWRHRGRRTGTGEAARQ